MAEFSKLVITNKGQALLAKMMTGEGNVEFTKISTSGMEYTLEQLEALTEFSGVKQTVSVAKVTRTNGVAVTIEAIFNNLELTQGYHMRALGLYAIDPDDGEILYAVTTEMSGCCYMPAYNGVTVSGACIKLVTTVGNAENVSLEVDPGVYATVGEIKELRESVDGIETWKDNTQKRLDNWGPTIVGHGQIINSLRDSIGNLKPVATSGDYDDLVNKPDLKPVAMSGSYNDLINKPEIPAAVRVKGNAERTYRTGEVNLTPENIGAVNKTGDFIHGNIVNSDIQYYDNADEVVENSDYIEWGVIKELMFNYEQLSISQTGNEESPYYGPYVVKLSHNCLAFNDITKYTKERIESNNFAFRILLDGKEGQQGITVNYSNKGFYSYNNLGLDLGKSSYKWKNIYAENGTIQTSDRNCKMAIKELSSEKAQNLVYGLKPSIYQMNSGNSGRVHWGIISQDIEILFEDLGWTSSDFAGFIKSPKVRLVTTDENGNKLEEPIEEILEGEFEYGLRYDEFIAPIIKVIQSQHEEIETLKQETQMLKQQMQQLMNKES